MRLMREVRCFSREPAGERVHSWAGVPPAGGVPFWVFRVAVEGPVDGDTGYVCDIKVLDGLIRAEVVPVLHEEMHVPVDRGEVELSDRSAQALRSAFDRAARACPSPVVLGALRWFVSPFLSFTVCRSSPAMVRVTQSFEFSAAHRLFRAHLSDAENLRLFGKCSHPHGHGHNYVLEVTVAGEPDPGTGHVIALPALIRIVNERVISAFDHRNLNVECPEFETMNPSVENISRVIWERLDGAFAPATLSGVRVWETPKTCAEYGEPLPA